MAGLCCLLVVLWLVGWQSPSPAFKATMAALERASNGGGANGSVQGGACIAARSSVVPLLQMGKLHAAAAAAEGLTLPACQVQQQQQTPTTGTRIPQATGSSRDSRLHQQRRQSDAGVASQVPLSGAHVSSAARVPLPDATPRGFKDAPPAASPRRHAPAEPQQLHALQGARTKQGTTTDAAIKGSLQQDVDARQTPDRQHKVQVQAQSVLDMEQRAAGIVPALQLGRLLAADRSSSSGLPAGDPSAAPSSRSSPPSPPAAAAHQQPSQCPAALQLSGQPHTTGRPRAG